VPLGRLSPYPPGIPEGGKVDGLFSLEKHLS
jgi:hypothetical protein